MALLGLFQSRLSPVRLPPPAKTNDCSLFSALEHRRTVRDIDPAGLPLQVLANLLWAAYGVNRKAGPFAMPGRTAASASNSQEIDLYVAQGAGAFLYDALQHRLEPVTAEDVRADSLTPGQAGVDAAAPVALIYVVDMQKLEYTRGYKEPGLSDPEVQKSYYYVDTGLVAANVYLYAAAEGLAAWFHNCDRQALFRKLKLRPSQRVLFAQSIGYPDGA